MVDMVGKSGWNCSAVIAKPSFLDCCLDKSPELSLKNQNHGNEIRFLRSRESSQQISFVVCLCNTALGTRVCFVSAPWGFFRIIISVLFCWKNTHTPLM